MERSPEFYKAIGIELVSKEDQLTFQGAAERVVQETAGSEALGEHFAENLKQLQTIRQTIEGGGSSGEIKSAVDELTLKLLRDEGPTDMTAEERHNFEKTRDRLVLDLRVVAKHLGAKPE